MMARNTFKFDKRNKEIAKQKKKEEKLLKKQAKKDGIPFEEAVADNDQIDTEQLAQNLNILFPNSTPFTNETPDKKEDEESIIV